MFNQGSTKTRVSRAKRSLFFQANSSQKYSNSSHLSQTIDNSFNMETTKYQKPYAERRNTIHPLDNRNNYEKEVNCLAKDHLKSSPQNSRNQQSVPVRKEKEQKPKIISSKYDLSKVQIQNQFFIIKNLSLINYSQENLRILEQKFMSLIKEHIQIKNNKPNALTVIGANVIADGKYHELWMKILERNDRLSKMSLKRIKKQYYKNYKDAVKINVNIFQQSVNEKESVTNFMDKYLNKQQVPSVSNEKNHQQEILEKENFQPEQEKHSLKKIMNEQKPFSNNESNQVQNQITTLNVPASRKNGDSSETQSEKGTTVSDADQNDLKALPINQALLKYRQVNQRRVAAEMVCKFFNITSDRTFSITEIKVEEILQLNQQPKSEYAILIGRKIVKKSNKKKIKMENQYGRSTQSTQRIQSNQYIQIIEGGDKCFISCYKYMNFEQLIRLQVTYGKIYGFIAYDKQVDFFQFLELNQGKNRLSLTYKIDSDDESPQENPMRERAFQESKMTYGQRNETKNTEKGKRNIYKRKRHD